MAVQGSDTVTLNERMRREWDARIAHDYRFWMGDGVADDATMLQVGERDFGKLFPELESTPQKQATVLELGCGVGRLLRPASRYFSRVIGVDVSQNAINEARRLLSDLSNVELSLGNGLDLAQLKNDSIDYAFSFAALSNMPMAVIARYLHELTRVLKAGGELRLQLFIGNELQTFAEDTLAVRSLRAENYERAIEALGLDELSREELKLPFEVSDYEAGAIAYIVTLKKVKSSSSSPDEVVALISADSERSAGAEWNGSETAYLMAIGRAQDHLDSGRLEEAKAALEYAVKNFKNAQPEVISILEQLRKKLAPVVPTTSASQVIERDWFGENSAVLQRRFSRTAQKLRDVSTAAELSHSTAGDGAPIQLWNGAPLDNAQRPQRASEAWVERSFTAERFRSADVIVVFGIGAGYHLEALVNRISKPIYLVETNLAVFKSALQIRDLRHVFERLSGIITNPADFSKELEQITKQGRVELLIHPQSQLINKADLDQIKGAFWSERGLTDLHPSIAVVGPIYGGTLPILGYTTKALLDLNQRVQPYDLSSFAAPYHNFKSYVKNSGRIDVLQSYYVEMLSQVVMEGINERPVDIVICMAQAPLSPRVLTELRNRGIITVMWFVEDCKRFASWQQLSRFFDYMFIIQKGEHLQRVEAAGAGRAIYLPVGCDPSIHAPVPLTPEERKRWGSDLSFVGAGYHNRQQMFAALAGRDFKIWGTEWPTCEPFKSLLQEEGRRLTPVEYNKIFNSTKINLNLHSSMERDGVEPNGDFVNPRTVELASCGAFQLVDNRQLLPEMFELGSEVATFTDRKEMLDGIDYYLAHPEERTKITRAAQTRALRDHTYEKRIRQMLGYIYADRYEEIRSRIANSPWSQTLEAAKPFSGLRSKLEKVYERGEEPTLDALVNDITDSKGKLSETDMRLLFLHHVRSQISVIETKRHGKKS